MKFKLLVLIILTVLFVVIKKSKNENEPRWWKGNLHTHTTRSDGDASPGEVRKWYANNRYDFVALTDHNVLQKGEKFNNFLVLGGEELTDRFINENKKGQVHIVIVNSKESLSPRWGSNAIEVLQNDLERINDLKAKNKFIYSHIAHPNLSWSLTAEDLYQTPGNFTIEIYNGYQISWDMGDMNHQEVEQIWDEANTRKLRGGLGIIYGAAVDDAHHYSDFQLGNANPGRGWVMVRSKKLDAKSIITALNSGDFYSSSGVALEDVVKEGKKIKIQIKGENGVTYKTEFLGEMGKVLKEDTSLTPEYELAKNDLYVRARIVSSKLKTNPRVQGEYETAWTQPMTP